MITLKHIRTKREVTKTPQEADIILNNKVTGKDWKIVSKVDQVETPPEVKPRVSISQEAQEVREKKSTKNNANRERVIK